MKSFLAVLFFVILSLFYYWFFFYFSAGVAGPEWYDFLLHLLGGAWLAGMAALFLYSEHARFRGGFWAFLILIFGVVMLFGVLWEFYEYLTSVYAGRQPDSLDDALSDLFAELIGALPIVLGYYRKSKNGD